MSFPFIIGMYCVLQLLSDKSMLSVVVICVIVAVSITSKSDSIGGKPVKDVDAGVLLKNSDNSLQLILSRLSEWKQYDEHLYIQTISNIDSFFRQYGLLLMYDQNQIHQKHSDLVQLFDILIDLRSVIINDLYTWSFKSSDIPVQFTNGIILPMIAITMKYIKVLCNKYPTIKSRYEETVSIIHGDFF